MLGCRAANQHRAELTHSVPKGFLVIFSESAIKPECRDSCIGRRSKTTQKGAISPPTPVFVRGVENDAVRTFPDRSDPNLVLVYHVRVLQLNWEVSATH